MTPPESESGRDLTSLKNRFFQLALETMETLLATTDDAPLSSQESPVMPAATIPPNPEWRWLHPDEEAVVRVLLQSDRPMRAKSISLALGGTAVPSTELRLTLRRLEGRHILRQQGGPDGGYVVNLAPGSSLPENL